MGSLTSSPALSFSHLSCIKTFQIYHKYCRGGLSNAAAASIPGGALLKDLVGHAPVADKAAAAPLMNQAGGVMLRRDKDGVSSNNYSINWYCSTFNNWQTSCIYVMFFLNSGLRSLPAPQRQRRKGSQRQIRDYHPASDVVQILSERIVWNLENDTYVFLNSQQVPSDSLPNYVRYSPTFRHVAVLDRVSRVDKVARFKCLLFREST